MITNKKFKKSKPDKQDKQSKKFKQTKNTNTFSNVRIIKILEIVKSYYARERNAIHVNAYERAIYQLKKWSHPIKKGRYVAHLEGIGKGMIQKINTILSTGTLPIIQEKGLSNGDGDRTKKSLSKMAYPTLMRAGLSGR
jgi:DNA polymerase/3'-5' exonuclease PolX